MNESQSISGKPDNLGATINDLREEAIAAKEENMSLKEELSSLKNKINMIYSSVGNDLSVSSPRFAGEATGSETYHKLAERVIGRSMTKEEFDGCCEDSVNIGVLNPVMYTIKKSLENPIVEGPLLERAEGEAATKAIQRKRERPSTKKKTTDLVDRQSVHY
ncbi:hypothetical protein EDC94DRAFT_587943 [Helicostylum pulchrum]|nr:hypothetical protein EDC94DRAFT_587943 [Helicostylum pulchrum]